MTAKPNTLPSSADVRQKLQELTTNQTIMLARVSGVPYGTLQKLRTGESSNPRIDTVHAIWPHLCAYVTRLRRYGHV